MNQAESQFSPQLYARTGGVLYLLVILLGFFAYGYVPGKLEPVGAAVTAKNLLAHALLWRTGIVGSLLVVVCAIPLLLCEYLLLRPVQRNIALLAMLFNLVSVAVESLSSLGHIAALAVADGQDSLNGLASQRVQALASLAVHLHDADLNISFLFFGCVCLLYGYLIFRSRFLPRALGVMMTLAGLCYASNSILTFLDLRVSSASGIPLLLMPAGLAELILCLWLLTVGVDVPKWHLWYTQSARMRGLP
jgi:hypothetical protein